jgi:hypothetical protein
MSEPFFRPAKKRPAFYVNTGKHRWAVEHDDPAKPPSPKLLEAIEAAEKAFAQVWYAKEETA